MSTSRRPGSILVTGAARGIGRATAELFLARGWRVGMYDVDPAAIADAAAGHQHAVHGCHVDPRRGARVVDPLRVQRTIVIGHGAVVGDEPGAVMCVTALGKRRQEWQHGVPVGDVRRDMGEVTGHPGLRRRCEVRRVRDLGVSFGDRVDDRVPRLTPLIVIEVSRGLVGAGK